MLLIRHDHIPTPKEIERNLCCNATYHRPGGRAIGLRKL